MRIVCPSCTAAYEVPDSLLPPGRAVRCARCGEEWAALEPELAPATEAEAEVEMEMEMAASPPSRPAWRDEPELVGPTAMERLAQSPAVLPSTTIALRAAWAASVGVLVLLFCAAYVWRSDIIRSWPPSVRVYDALGLATPDPPAPRERLTRSGG